MIDGIKKQFPLPLKKFSSRDWSFTLKQVNSKPRELILVAAPQEMNFISFSMKQLCFLLIALFALTSMLAIATRAAYSDDAPLSEMEVSAGTWIPDIEMGVDPAEGPELVEGREVYTEPPCVTLTSSLPHAKIYYEFSDDSNPLSGGTEYIGECVEIPVSADEKTKFQAQAVHPDNNTWKSPVIKEEFLVVEEEIETLSAKKADSEKKEEKDDEAESSELVEEIKSPIEPSPPSIEEEVSPNVPKEKEIVSPLLVEGTETLNEEHEIPEESEKKEEAPELSSQDDENNPSIEPKNEESSDNGSMENEETENE